MAKRTLGNTPTTNDTDQQGNLRNTSDWSNARDIPTMGIHAPRWADDTGTDDGDGIMDKLLRHNEHRLPVGTYRAQLAGVGEWDYHKLSRNCRWLFAVTERITPNPDMLPWQIPAMAFTGGAYGVAGNTLTQWVDVALGHPVEPAELEAVGLAVFINQPFEIEVNNQGRVESCRLLTDDPNWWKTATERYYTGRYCRAWHDQTAPRRRPTLSTNLSNNAFAALAQTGRFLDDSPDPVEQELTYEQELAAWNRLAGELSTWIAERGIKLTYEQFENRLPPRPTPR